MYPIILALKFDTGQDSLNVIVSKVKEGFHGVETQPATTEKYSDLDSGPATYGVVKRKRDNDMDLHTDRQVCFSFSLIINLRWFGRIWNFQKTSLRK